jgi:Trypsin
MPKMDVMTQRVLTSIGAFIIGVAFTCVPAHAIVGGQLAGDQYDAVGEVVFQPSNSSEPMFDLCSGFLISPTVLVTAGHCAIEALDIQASLGGTIGAAFDPTFDPAQSAFRPAGSVVVHPDFLANQHSYETPDVAVLVLEQPVRGIEPIDLPTAGAADRLPNGTRLTTLGYGFTQQCGTDLGHCQVSYMPARRLATETLISTSQWFITVVQNPNTQGVGGVCRGDSGGPHLLQGTGTAVAVTTSINSRWCWSTSRDSRIDTPSALQFLWQFAPS